MLLTLSLTLLLAADSGQTAAREALGERLFHDTRFSSPQGDMITSCALCHTADDPLGYRAFTELFSRSWVPWRSKDRERETLRNTPTVLDLADHRFIHFDGEFRSLEEQSRKTITGRNFGWFPEERETALAQILAVMREDGPRSYREAFLNAYGVDIHALDGAETVDAIARAISDFVRGLKSERSSPYDVFAAANGIPPAPRPGEGPKRYGVHVLERVAALERTESLKLSERFDLMALEGYKIFLRSAGTGKAGNCVTCHVPPSFTDRIFHNAGVTQDAYDGQHGHGSFLALDIPIYADARRPVNRFHSPASRKRPGEVDLGYWNFAMFGNSPLYHAQDSETEFLDRTIATFKTPTLRNVSATDPYMHNGAYVTLEDVLDQKIRAAFFARMGQLRNSDPELEAIHIISDDIPALFAFLNALNDAGKRVSVPSRKPLGEGAGIASRYAR